MKIEFCQNVKVAVSVDAPVSLDFHIVVSGDNDDGVAADIDVDVVVDAHHVAAFSVQNNVSVAA